MCHQPMMSTLHSIDSNRSTMAFKVILNRRLSDLKLVIKFDNEFNIVKMMLIIF